MVHNLGLGVAYQERTFSTKIGGVWAREHSKNVAPLLISATVEFNDFKFGIQLGFAEYNLPNITFRTKIGWGLD